MKKKFTRVVPEDVQVDQLTPLDITCGATKCDDGFHCFSKKKSSVKNYGKVGVCKECGIELVDWERLHQNKLSDSQFVFESLKTELIRHVFFHASINDDAIQNALSLGRNALKDKARKIVRQRISKRTAWDGRQTPMGGDSIINYAQHATATCCRQCLEAWHGINPDLELSQNQLDYCIQLIMLYIHEKLPELEE